jgi:hypothetical protein
MILYLWRYVSGAKPMGYDDRSSFDAHGDAEQSIRGATIQGGIEGKKGTARDKLFGFKECERKTD